MVFGIQFMRYAALFPTLSSSMEWLFANASSTPLTGGVDPSTVWTNHLSAFADAPWCQKDLFHNNGITNVYSALHKSGSMWLHENLLGLCFLANKDYYSTNGCSDSSRYGALNSSARFSASSTLHLMDEESMIMADIPPDSCIGPIRHFESWAPHLHRNPTHPIVHLFMLRNPLDVLVSRYYSFGWTHGSLDGSSGPPNPEIQEMTIDDYVVTALPELRENFDNLHKTLKTSCCTLASDPNCIYFCVAITYEESVVSYATWLGKVSKTLSCNDEARTVFASIVFQKESLPLQDIMNKHTEANNGHIRSGVPGNYAQHLSDSTIALVRDQFADVFELLRFSLSAFDQVDGFYPLPEKTTWQ